MCPDRDGRDQAVHPGRTFQGIDSQVARGLVGMREADKLVVYALFYDSDPCGGGCPEKGHTEVKRCLPFSPGKAGCDELLRCFECGALGGSDVVEDCLSGPLAP